MRSFIRTNVLAITLVGIVMGAWVTSAHASREAISANTFFNKIAITNSFRSAFLGPDVWEDNLSSAEIKRQLQEHFAQVIERLESNNAISLLRALTRAEASAAQPWTKAQRREALIFLATNRQRQIACLRYYMNRGLFPQNEGQSISAVPIFVDRHQTHCAVGFLMHSDGNDSDVASIVETNNLVRVNDVRRGSMMHWIRSSGLTQEEAALIQPSYPVGGLATFDALSTPGATLQQNGLVVSEVTFRNYLFDTTLPTNFQSDPTALQAIFDLGKAGVEAGNFDASQVQGGISLVNQYFSPQNLDESLYIGTSSNGFSPSPLVRSSNFLGNDAAFFQADYLIRSQQDDFSQIALTVPRNTSGGFISNSSSAVLLLSKIYDGNTDELLGETQVSQVGGGLIDGTDSIQPATDFVRIETHGLIVGDVQLFSFFNEFETSAVPEPGTGSVMILIGAVAVTKRRRKTS